MRVEWLASIWFPACAPGRWLLVCQGAASPHLTYCSPVCWVGMVKTHPKAVWIEFGVGLFVCVSSNDERRTHGPARLCEDEGRPSGETAVRQVLNGAWCPLTSPLSRKPHKHTVLHILQQDLWLIFTWLQLKMKLLLDLGFPLNVCKGYRGDHDLKYYNTFPVCRFQR